MKKFAAALLLAGLSVAAFASPETDSVLATLKSKYPNTNFTSIEASPLPGIYELTMGKNIAYTDKEGHYFLFGSLYDMEKRQDLTAPKREAASKIDVSKLPLKDAIVRVKGKGTRKLYLFTDPDCPFCKELERDTLPKLDDVTIYTFMFPLDSLHPQARAKSESIWCLPEKERGAAWDKLLTTGTPPAMAKCDNPLAALSSLGDSLGVRGTPTMFSEDGRILPGAAAPERIDAFLNAGK
ncbi:thiol:disulfide interchange protein (plasmid) [Burkholderia sp. SFA1]|uniref:Thiol:disulfide interchange protein n=1 Tax=Burkholderia vietnamiensis (strain G4 / LMG 22486) TaxID=269482 RepID=A4JUG2_BURVG|nr:protein-disulfide isomerase [Burkholderia vietnamiensis G4]AET95450.1 protein-disulfide isomerase [Burkholderia sp. YI23]MCB4349921.1 DsbC family protein [Burkholderia vietnamiensis]BBQ03154.1 thiol:disulfide interchange protein [Burkholderia sp. SFA1]